MPYKVSGMSFKSQPEWYASMQAPTDLRGFSIKADEASTLSQIVMTPYGNLTDNITIKSQSEIDDIEEWTSQMSVAPILDVGTVQFICND